MGGCDNTLGLRSREGAESGSLAVLCFARAVLLVGTWPADMLAHL